METAKSKKKKNRGDVKKGRNENVRIQNKLKKKKTDICRFEYLHPPLRVTRTETLHGRRFVSPSKRPTVTDDAYWPTKMTAKCTGTTSKEHMAGVDEN